MIGKSRHAVLLGGGKRNDIEFLSDSAEQIARSINMTGLRTEKNYH